MLPFTSHTQGAFEVARKSFHISAYLNLSQEGAFIHSFLHSSLSARLRTRPHAMEEDTDILMADYSRVSWLSLGRAKGSGKSRGERE